jgi:nitrate reductase gamma subunit
MGKSIAYIILLAVLIFTHEISWASQSVQKDGISDKVHSTLQCMACHSYITDNPDHPVTEGRGMSCLECHEDFSAFSPDKKLKVDCLKCHYPHNEQTAHDAHTGVPCWACHLEGVQPAKEIKNGLPVWSYEPFKKAEYDPHRITGGDKRSCLRCHFKGNNLGASDHALPAKGITCIPCHASTFSIGDTPSMISIIIFIIGITAIVIIWFSAGKGHKKIRFSLLINVFSALILDGFFQRRLLRVSKVRWGIHAIIFFPLIARFLCGITATCTSIWLKGTDEIWILLDKNHPATGLFFDVTGLMILAGGCFMFIERRISKKKRDIKGMPDKINCAAILVLGIIITGFILEGVRIAMTGAPLYSQYSFIGYHLSRLMIGFHLNGIYAYLWYLHAVITCAFIAMVPFSSMKHLFMAPVSLGIKAVSKE